MKSAYAPTLTFEEDTHTYRLDGMVVPSVTQILKELGFVDFSGIDPEVLRKKAELGTYVHKCCELLFQQDLDIENVDPEALGYVRAFEKFLIEMCSRRPSFLILEMEKKVSHPFLPGMRPAFASFRSQSGVMWRKAAASSKVRVFIYPPYPV